MQRVELRFEVLIPIQATALLLWPLALVQNWEHVGWFVLIFMGITQFPIVTRIIDLIVIREGFFVIGLELLVNEIYAGFSFSLIAILEWITMY